MRGNNLPLVGDGDAGVRKAAVIALGELGDVVDAALRQLLSSPDKVVRKAASSALFGAGPPKRKSSGRNSRRPPQLD